MTNIVYHPIYIAGLARRLRENCGKSAWRDLHLERVERALRRARAGLSFRTDDLDGAEAYAQDHACC